MVRTSESPIPFLASKSWSACASVMLCPKNAEDAPNPSIVCLTSAQLTVTSLFCAFDEQPATPAQTRSRNEQRDFHVRQLLTDLAPRRHCKSVGFLTGPDGFP